MPAIIIVMILAMYFLMIRPQNKRRREMMEKQRQAGPGQTVVTIGGLHATIIDSDDTTVTLEVSPGVMCVYERGAIARVLDDDGVDEDTTTDSEPEDGMPATDAKADEPAAEDSKAGNRPPGDGTQN